MLTRKIRKSKKNQIRATSVVVVIVKPHNHHLNLQFTTPTSFLPLLSKTQLSLSFDHPYPPTKLMFHPSTHSTLQKTSSNLPTTSRAYLRLWEVWENSTEALSLFNNSKTSEFCAPITSFNWNEIEPKRIGTSSIGTTCTIWDIERGRWNRVVVEEVWVFGRESESREWIEIVWDKKGSLSFWKREWIERELDNRGNLSFRKRKWI